MVKFFIGDTPDERSGIVACLVQQQEAFAVVSYGLTEDQARAKPSASSLSIGGLIKHVTATQHGWTQRVLAAPGLWKPLNDGPSRHTDSFDFRSDETLEGLRAALDEQNAATLRAIETADLDTPVPVPVAPWFPKDREAWSVRWVGLHLIEELARHAGHADIIRESIDGATTHSLMAAMMGLPETEWLKPWQPAELR